MTLQEMAIIIGKANNDRLEGRMTRPEHAVIISGVNDWLMANGYNWDHVAEMLA